MNLGSVTSVFSRYVVIGFILPPFFALLILWKTLSGGFPPNQLHYSDAGNVAVLGGLALLAGLLLLGLHPGILDFFAGGRPTVRGPRWAIRLTDWVGSRMARRMARRRDALRADLDGLDPGRRFEAMRTLDRFFPLPPGITGTRLGNVIRGWKGHSISRWRLEYDAAWPRIEAMLTEQERSLHDDARTNIAFFLNSSFVAFLSACAYLGDYVAYRWPSHYDVLWVAGAVLLAYLFYRQTVMSAARLGDRIRASIDLHRLELYASLSVLEPTTLEQEERIAAAVNRALLYRVPLPDDCRRPGAPQGKPSWLEVLFRLLDR
jgi:hypothetical protein